MTQSTYGPIGLNRLAGLCLLGVALLNSACTTSQMSLQSDLSSDSGDMALVGTPGTSVAPPIWPRLQGNFSLPHSSNPRIAKQRALLLKHPRHLSRTQEQAEPYIGFVLDEVEKRGMPGEVALLPMIESGYKPKAQSPSRASGLWQFIPATGRAFGLSSNHWYEGRQDIVASTRAALDYLERINQEFDNDWELTLAAYNAGEPSIRRAIRKNRKQGKPTDFWSLDLPKETRNYVPKLLALKQIFTTPELYGVALHPIEDRKRVQVVELDSPIDLRLAAQLAEIGMEKLRKFNPGFKSWFTGPKDKHELLLPTEKAEQFNQRVAQLPPEERLRLTEHRVVKGDTLRKLALRYNCDVALIKTTNGLKSDRLKVASTLLIPQPYSLATSDNEPIKQIQRKLVYQMGDSKPAI